MTDTTDHCLCEAIFGFRAAREQARVRAFYGDAVYDALRKWEREQREQAVLRARVAYDLIDDVSQQVK